MLQTTLRARESASEARVLVADGERGARESLRMVLAPAHHVLLAHDAGEALALLRATPVDVVTLEPGLPGGGADLLGRLRAEHPRLEVVVVTDRADVETAAAAVRAGARDYLLKPFDVADVRAAVERAAARRRGGDARQADEACLTQADEWRFLAVLSATIEAQHPFLRGHAERTSLYAALLAERVGLSRGECEQVRIAGFLHDIGKVGVPSEILAREGVLPEAERRRLERHPEIGARLVDPLEVGAAVADAIRHHHERWDGAGYPAGLAGEAIPVTARIVALADAHDAMSCDRPYRRALRPTAVRRELARWAGRQFDPRLTKEFLALLESSDVELELLGDALGAERIG